MEHKRGEKIENAATSSTSATANDLSVQWFRRLPTHSPRVEPDENENVEERAEYEGYVVAGGLIAVLQAKARLLLARRGRPA